MRTLAILIVLTCSYANAREDNPEEIVIDAVPATVVVEISMYPTRAEDPIAEIDAFLVVLNSNPDIIVETNRMSTLIYGEYALVMQTLQAAMLDTRKSLFVMKIVPRATRTINGYDLTGRDTDDDCGLSDVIDHDPFL